MTYTSLEIERRRRRKGAWMASIGATAFVVSSFLPMLRIDVRSIASQSGTSTTLYHLFVGGQGKLVQKLGAYMLLWGGAATMLIISAKRIRSGDRSRAASALAAATVWSLMSGGLLLEAVGKGHAFLIGYWLALAGLALALAGAIIGYLASIDR